MDVRQFLALLFISLFVLACGGDGEGENVDEWGRPILSATDGDEIVPSKDDAITGQRGLPVSVDSSNTAVWEVSNAWADTDPEEGMAWGENSGLTWDEKYQKWVGSLEQIDSEGGFFSNKTFMLTTPWGREVPSPTLECAEVAIFLRVTFASWYNLPFFLEARDKDGRIYFGHFGMRRATGKYGQMPNFKTRYKDFSDQWDDVLNGGDWPSDSELTGKKIPGSFDDEQPQLGEGKHAGDYFDEIYLNKRVGHFIILTLVWFGSVNLADSVNTFNLRPDAIKPGDVLLERWQKVGIGHTLVVMRADDVGTKDVDGEVIPQLEVQMGSGSMPRRQPVWETPGASKRYFTLSNTGGEGFAELGGGLKRWRTAKNVNGRWTNVVMPDYASDWINSKDLDEIAARIERFRNILVELSPDQKRDVLVGVIDGKRQHLRRFPASCSARINREDAFESLYELMDLEFDMSAEEVDAEFRTFEDYVFAELEYQKSKTCCWNRSTSAMYEIIMDFATREQEDAQACVPPSVFMNREDAADGFQLFRDHAESLGRGADWVDWSADETCPWQDIPEATIVESDHVAFCDLPDGSTEPPVDPPVGGEDVVLDFGTGDIPDNDDEGLRLEVESTTEGELTGASLDIDISHTWRGDLEIEIVHPDGTSVMLKESDSSDEDGFKEILDIEGFAGKSATGTYVLIVRDTASQDTGSVDGASLTLTVAN